MMLTRNNDVQTENNAAIEPATLDLKPMLIEPFPVDAEPLPLMPVDGGIPEPVDGQGIIGPCVIFPESEEIQALYKQLDEIFGTPDFDLTEDEQKQVDALYEKANAFFEPNENGEWPELTEAQEKELEAIYDQIDDIYGIVNYDDLSEEQQKKVDGIYAELDKLWADQINILPVEPIDEETQALYDRLDEIFGTYKQELTEDEQKQVDELNNKIEAILSPDEDGDWPELTEEQQEELNGLYKQIDKVYGVVAYDDLSEEQQKEVDGIYEKLDAIYLKDLEIDGSDGLVTILPVFDEKTQALFDELDEIFGSPKSELTEEEQAQVDALNEKVDALLAPNDKGEWPELTEEQETELNGLFKQIDKVYGVVSYDDLTEAQQQRVDAIYEELSAEPLITEEPDTDIVDGEPMISVARPFDKDSDNKDDLLDLDNFDFSKLETVSQLNTGTDAGDNWIDFGMFEFVGNVDGQEMPGIQTLELTGLADFDFDFAGF